MTPAVVTVNSMAAVIGIDKDRSVSDRKEMKTDLSVMISR